MLVSESFETACVIEEDVEIHPFAFRTHAHRHGVEVSGWVVNEVSPVILPFQCLSYSVVLGSILVGWGRGHITKNYLSDLRLTERPQENKIENKIGVGNKQQTNNKQVAAVIKTSR